MQNYTIVQPKTIKRTHLKKKKFKIAMAERSHTKNEKVK